MEISIILPTYRPEGYLWECLESIDKQTLDHSLFEVLLVLNGEREPYERQIQTFLDSRPDLPCRMIYNEEKGVSAARNRGLDEARGEYICFIDDDDLITPTYLEALYARATKETVPLSYITIFDDGTDIFVPNYITRDYQESDANIPYRQARRYFNVPYCKMIHRDVIGTRRFDKALKNGEDALFLFLVSDRFKWVRFTDKTAEYHYRQRSTSAFNAKKPVTYHISNMLTCQFKASKIFWAHPLRYSFCFYAEYMLAIAMGCFRKIIGTK